MEHFGGLVAIQEAFRWPGYQFIRVTPPHAHVTCRPDARRRSYLQVGVVNRERRAEETLDNGHHCLCHVFLQGRIGVVTICGGVAHL